NLNPGKTSSVTAAPPSTCLRSQTRTLFPARARYAAFTRPLCPPPITTTSYLEWVGKFFCSLCVRNPEDESTIPRVPGVKSGQISADGGEVEESAREMTVHDLLKDQAAVNFTAKIPPLENVENIFEEIWTA